MIQVQSSKKLVKKLLSYAKLLKKNYLFSTTSFLVVCGLTGEFLTGLFEVNFSALPDLLLSPSFIGDLPCGDGVLPAAVEETRKELLPILFL